jgi:hypothetical protein
VTNERDTNKTYIWLHEKIDMGGGNITAGGCCRKLATHRRPMPACRNHLKLLQMFVCPASGSFKASEISVDVSGLRYSRNS